MSNDAKINWSIGDRPTAIVGFDQADRLPGQRGGDVDRVALPADLAAVAHSPDIMVGAVFRLPEDAVETPGRGCITRGCAQASNASRPFRPPPHLRGYEPRCSVVPYWWSPFPLNAPVGSANPLSYNPYNHESPPIASRHSPRCRPGQEDSFHSGYSFCELSRRGYDKIDARIRCFFDVKHPMWIRIHPKDVQ